MEMATLPAPSLVAPGDAGLVPASDAGFHALYEDHHTGLYRFCLGMLRDADDARDAVQATMMKALQALRAGKEPLSPRAWLYTIARNESLDMIRRRRGDTDLGTVPELAAPELDHQTRATVAALLADLHRLPEQQRSAVVLRELQGLEYEEIADVLATTPGNARQSVYKARTALFDLDRGRDLACEQVRRAISEADGRALPPGPMRAHLEGCVDCRAFRDSIRRRGARLALLPGPPVLLDVLREGTLAFATTGAGVTVGATGSATVASAGAAGATAAAISAPGAAVGGIGALLASIPGVGLGAGKILAVTAVLATAGGGAVVAERQGMLAGGPPAQTAAPASAPADVEAPGRTTVGTIPSGPDTTIVNASQRRPADEGLPAASETDTTSDGTPARAEEEDRPGRPASTRPSTATRPGIGTRAPGGARPESPAATRPGESSPGAASTSPAVVPARPPAERAPVATAPSPAAPAAVSPPTTSAPTPSGTPAPSIAVPTPATAPTAPVSSAPAPVEASPPPAPAPAGPGARGTTGGDLDVRSRPDEPR
jgi:RNA polymerase sigma factor (sigma-70 family)